MQPANRKRDTDLMRSALFVIEAVLDADRAIGGAFREPQGFF